jgi:hypothetical protein
MQHEAMLSALLPVHINDSSKRRLRDVAVLCAFLCLSFQSLKLVSCFLLILASQDIVFSVNYISA